MNFKQTLLCAEHNKSVNCTRKKVMKNEQESKSREREVKWAVLD